MKKTIITTACALASLGAFGQGTMAVSNNNQINSVLTGTAGLGPASGGTFEAEVYIGSSASSLTAVPASIATVNGGFFFGGGSTGVIALPGVVAGAATGYEVKVWDSSAGATFEVASVKPGVEFGVSAFGQYTTGGAGAPPSAPQPMNFATFTTTITPEPTTLALGALGLGALLIRRRK